MLHRPRIVVDALDVCFVRPSRVVRFGGMSSGKGKSASAASSAVSKQTEQKPEESKEDLVEQVLELHTVLKGILFSC